MYRALTGPRRVAALAAATALLAGGSAAAQQPSRAGFEEAFVSVRLGWSETILEALYYQGTFFLPVTALLRSGRIDAVWDAAARSVSGYYLREGNRYRIDAGGTAVLGGRTASVPPDAVFADDDDLYTVPAVLEELFGWHLDVNLGDLRITVVTTDTFPADREALRVRMRQAAAPAVLREEAPLRFPRLPSRLGGGVLQYGLHGDVSPGSGNGAFDVAAGGEVLGGGLEARAAGGTALPLTARAAWHYAFRGETGLQPTQFAAGHLTSTGLMTAAFSGVQLTNAPVVPDVRQGSAVVEGLAGDRWDVELYYQGQLVDYATADETGRYRFVVPVTYGSAVYSVRMYEPGGAVIVREERLQVPYGVLRRGRAEYQAGAGRAEVTGEPLALARLAWGATDHVTLFGGFERRADATGLTARLPYVGSAFRLPHTAAGTVEYAAGGFRRITADVLTPAGTGVSLSFTDFEAASPYNPQYLDLGARGTAFVPLPLGARTANARVAGEWGRFLHGGGYANVDADAAVALPYSTLRVGTRQAWSWGSQRVTRADQLRVALNGLVPRNVPGALHAARGAFIMTSLSYDRRLHRVDQLVLEMSRNVTPGGRITVAAARSPLTGYHSVELRFQQYGRRMYSAAATRRDPAGSAATGSVRGSLGMEWDERRAVLSPRDWVGRAGVVFVPFIDADGDGAFGPDDMRIDAPVIRFREAVATRVAPDGTVVATDLMPYRRYSVDIVTDAVPSPLWLPRDTAFSFVAAPSTFRVIHIPFYVGGVLEGMVVDSDGGRPLGGLRVVIRTADGRDVAAVRSFTGGSFYHMGLPPGDYTAAVVDDDLRAIGAAADPVPFTLRPDPDGDLTTVTIRVRRQG